MFVANHWKVGSIYYYYDIFQRSDDKYELRIELNKKVVKTKVSDDDKWLRAYVMGYIDFLYSTNSTNEKD